MDGRLADSVASTSCEYDVNLLIDSFYLQVVQHGKECNLKTFKNVWSQLRFSFVHQADAGRSNSASHVQLLYSAALNRLDSQCPVVNPEQQNLEDEAQQLHGAPGQAAGQGTAEGLHKDASDGSMADRPPSTEGASSDQAALMQELEDLFNFMHSHGIDTTTLDVHAVAASAPSKVVPEAHSSPALDVNNSDQNGTLPGTREPQDEPGIPQDTSQHQQEQNLPPLAICIGAIYTLYCLYQTQDRSQPPVNIYLPLELLDVLAGIVPDLKASGALEAIKILQVLWRNNVFLVGAARLPPTGTWKPDQVGGTVRQRGQMSSGLTINSFLMENRALRDALFHIRSDLKSLTDFKRLQHACDAYHESRPLMFQPDRITSAAPPLPEMLFPADFAKELQAQTEKRARSVQQELLPQIKPPARRLKQKLRPTNEDGPHELSDGGAPPRNVERPFVGGVTGDIIRQQLRATLPDEDVPAGLTGHAADVFLRHQARRQETLNVTGSWLATHSNLIQQDQVLQQQQSGSTPRLPGPSGLLVGSAPSHVMDEDDGDDMPSFNGVGFFKANAATGTDHLRGQRLSTHIDSASDTEPSIQHPTTSDVVPSSHDSSSEEPAHEEELHLRQDRVQTESIEGRSNAEKDPSTEVGHDLPAASDLVMVWCNLKPGLLSLETPLTVSCFCTGCHPEHPAFGMAAFVRHCGLKSTRWKQSIVVDEELAARTRGGINHDAVACLLEGRQPPKRGGTKLGIWIDGREVARGIHSGQSQCIEEAQAGDTTTVSPYVNQPSTVDPSLPEGSTDGAKVAADADDDEYNLALAQFSIADQLMAEIAAARIKAGMQLESNEDEGGE